MSERNYSTLTLNKSKLAQLKFLSQLFGKTEAMLVSEFIDALMEICTPLDKASYWLTTSSQTNCINYQIISEKSHIISGEMPAPECLGERTNQILEDRLIENISDTLASQSGTKTKKVKCSENVAMIKADIQTRNGKIKRAKK